MPNETLIELTGLVGMDFVVIDTEHGPADQIPLGQHLTAATAVGIPALVRVGDPTEILRVLDLGAAGIIAPHISSVEQAEAVVRAASYPPRGDRGFATYSRSGRQGLVDTAEHLRNAEANTAVILMIEDARGVDAAEAIAAVPGVDALFVGPADLAVSLGVPGQQSGQQIQQVIREVQEAAHRAGVAVASITADAESARAQFRAGSTMVIYNALSALGGLFTRLADGRPNEPVRPTTGGSSTMIGATIAHHATGGTTTGSTIPSGPASPIITTAAAPAPLVLLPGMMSTPRVWEAVISRLDPSLRAAGFRIDRDDDISGMAESVLAQAPQRFSLAGHSLGGIVALEVARQAPQRLDRLILLNCSGRAPSEGQLIAWSELADRIGAGDFDAVAAEQALVNLGAAAADERIVAAWKDDAAVVGPQGLLRELAAQRNRPDSLPGLAALGIATLVIAGALDDVSPPALQRELAANIPRARLATVEGAGHTSPIDSPKEVARLISDFLMENR